MKNTRGRRSAALEAAARKSVQARDARILQGARECNLGCMFSEPLAAVMSRGAESNRAAVEYHRAGVRGVRAALQAARRHSGAEVDAVIPRRGHPGTGGS